ncbi:AAA family ATPase [Pectobacterium aroidearum]|uniref:AAA family ATPase n=1 Tax=Pectobacterium aroidearum TaxID=1201031 RepID=UPI0026190F22|nr:ATP-binding protein [Pectobacterium aroidearum]WKA63958.1 ATP-binding protein [Pectobacterium aroidearum]
MFIQFSFKNYLSFKDEATLSMLAAKIKSKDKNLDKRAVFNAFPDIDLLKTVVLYGANGSGKSNVFSALSFMKRMVINSSKESQADEDINVLPFKLNPRFEDEPSSFEIIFIINNKLYEYTFSAARNKITSETLSVIEKNKGEVVLFKRNTKEIRVHDQFKEGIGLEKRTRKNALFLSVCANFDGEVSKSVIRWFRKIRVIQGMNDIGYLPFTVKLLDDENKRKKIKSIIDMFDLDIVNISKSQGEHKKESELLDAIFTTIKKDSRFKNLPLPKHNPLGVATTHNRFNDEGVFVDTINFELDEDESEGTKKLIALAGPLMDTFDNSYILFIDEFDARLHPLITKKIIRMFNSLDINKNNAQLVVATHDTNLLDKDELRRDQIWFAEKDSLGGSHLKQLVEYKVRNDASYRKGYFEGDFGAIPMLGEPDLIFGSDLN